MWKTQNKLKAVSDICRDSAQVFLATMLVEPIVRGGINATLIGAGLSLSLIFWLLSLASVQD